MAKKCASDKESKAEKKRETMKPKRKLRSKR